MRNEVKLKSKEQRMKKALKLDLLSLKGECIPGPAQKNISQKLNRILKR